jgi:TRAP-type C4-dicarboxylate transport system permease small subunit
VKFLRAFDRGLARGEAVIATFVLVTMILAATLQAVFRNLATEVGWQGANVVIGHLDWVDGFLQTGTLWLAFLGASLATHEERHIAIDILPRVASRSVELVAKGIVSIGAAAVSLVFARAFWGVFLVAAGEQIPSPYGVFAGVEEAHVCDAPPTFVTGAGLEVPTVFCWVRTSLDTLGVVVQTPQAALQLIVPVMFVVIAMRLFANGIRAFVRLRAAPAPESRESAS